MACFAVSSLMLSVSCMFLLWQQDLTSSVSLQQLRANIREMEKLCTRVRAEDTAALEALVKPVRDRASAAARDFLLLHSNLAPQPPLAAAQPSSCVSSSSHADDNMDKEPVSGSQMQLRLPEIPADQSAAESWDNLEEVSMSRPPDRTSMSGTSLNSILANSLSFFLFKEPMPCV